MSQRLVLLTLVLSLASSIHAQRYFTHTYGLREGLPSTEISSIAQDRQGRMYFATRLGLAVYDGFGWHVESPEPLLGGRTYTHMQQDSLGRLWVSTETAVFVKEEDSWRALPSFEHRTKPTQPIPLDLALIEIEGVVRPVVVFDTGRVLVFQKGRWLEVPITKNEARDPIRAVLSLGDRLIFATVQALRIVDARSFETSEVIGLGCSEVLALAEDPETGQVWCVGANFLGQIDPNRAAGETQQLEVKTRALEIDERRLAGHAVRAAADGRGGLYFGSSVQVFRHDPIDGLESLGRESGLIASGAHDFFLDREQNIWVATSRGVTKIVSRRLAGYDAEHGLYGDEVSAIAEGPGGRIIFGHNAAGLTLVDPDTMRVLRLADGGPNGRVMDLAVAEDGAIWAACESIGLFRIASDEESARTGKDPTRIYPIPDRIAVSTIEFDRRGRLWVGTSQGLFRLEEDELRPILVNPLGRSIQIRRIVRGSSNRLYVATLNRGLFVIDGDQVTGISEPPELRSTYTALENESGEIWVGSREGLCRLSGGRLELSENPPLRRPVYALVEDSTGRLWVGTDNGVYRWDGENLDHLSSENGLFGLEVNRAAALLDSRGRVWIGTDRGVSAYLPREETRISPGPTVEILEVKAGGKSHPGNRAITLGQDIRDLGFRIRAISFVDEARVRFRTRLEGLDTDWSEPRLLPLRELRYPNLSPGRYRLQIQAIDAEGREGLMINSSWVDMAKPFWQESWFVMVMVVIVATFGAGVYALIEQRRHGRALQAQVRARTDELRKAAEAQARITRLDSLGVLAGGIAHDFNNLLTAIGGNLSLLQHDPDLAGDSRLMLGQVEKACIKAEGLTRQLLTFSRGGAPVREVTDVAGVLRDAVEFSLRGSSMDCRFDLPSDLPPVLIDVGQFQQVFSNIAINARQATKDEGRLQVRARTTPSKSRTTLPLLVIEISDDGPGVDPKVLTQIFDPYFSTKTAGTGLGLAIAHSIVHKHGGRLEAESKPDQGTTFRITIPTTDRTPDTRSEASAVRQSFAGRVLVMDDQNTVRMFAKKVLERLGCEVVECADGEQAVRAFEQALELNQPFEALLMDLTVPGGMGGLEASQRILALDAEARIIVSSGYSKDAALADHEAQGFKARLPKPYGPDDLALALARVLSRDATDSS